MVTGKQTCCTSKGRLGITRAHKRVGERKCVNCLTAAERCCCSEARADAARVRALSDARIN